MLYDEFFLFEIEQLHDLFKLVVADFEEFVGLAVEEADDVVLFGHAVEG